MAEQCESFPWGESDRHLIENFETFYALWDLMNSENVDDPKNDCPIAERFHWIVGAFPACPSKWTRIREVNQAMGSLKNSKLLILLALGTIPAASGTEEMRRCAERLVSINPRPSDKQAFNMLKGWYYEAKTQLTTASIEQLADRIIAAISSYNDSHSGLTSKMISVALSISHSPYYPEEDEPDED
jgi:hypothetical protein